MGVAATLQRRWGCPNAGHKPPEKLPPDLEDEARYHAETVGLVPLRLPGQPAPPLPATHRTCPFAARLTPWARQVARVMRASGDMKGAVSAEEILGRPPHVWDVAAFDAVILARGEVAESNAAIFEREQAEKAKNRKP